jgi:hypothetical protein
VKLDCETPEIAMESLAEILRIDKVKLCNRIGGIKAGDFEVNTSIEIDRWLPMLNFVAGREVVDISDGQTCWFHATRVKDLSSFREGIWSLPNNISRIWTSLYSFVADVVSPEAWNDFRRETVADNYGVGLREVFQCWMANEGPYAFLFPESALNPKDIGNHDYFATSELVEWIAICFERKFRVSLHDRHHLATQPAFIKFWMPGIKAGHLGAALDYLLHRSAGWSLSCLDPNFSADGEQIAPAQVIKAIPILENGGGFRKYPSYALSPVNAHVRLHI